MNTPTPLHTACSFAAVCLLTLSAAAESDAIRPDLTGLPAGIGWQLFNRSAGMIEGTAQTAVRLSGGGGLGLAILNEFVFSEGSIEFDVRGKGATEESFVGIAFHGINESTFDAVYFKPAQFACDDEVRRSRAMQYVSMPHNNWPILRKRYPGMYEKPVVPVPDPASWFHVKVVVQAGEISVYLNGSQESCLTAKQVSHQGRGWIAFWVGNGSDGDFADLQIRPL